MADDIPFDAGGAMRAYRDHVISVLGYKIPQVTSGAELIELAKRTAAPKIEAEYFMTTDPPFPGLAEAPEKMGASWRMICACRISWNGAERGVLFTTFISGRSSTVVITSPHTVIPDDYKPLASR